MRDNSSFSRRCPAALPAIIVAASFLLAGSSPAQQQEPEPLGQRIDRLITQLGDPSYAVRQQAQDDLAKIGFDAYEQLEAATENRDLEIAARAKYLLGLIRVQWIQPSDPPEVRELMEDYEFQPGEERLDRIRQLGHLSGGKGIGPLCRLVRFEGSELLSKYAAIEILDRRPADRLGQQRWTRAVRENLPRQGSGNAARRPAARWLLAYLKLQDDPQAGLAEWTRLVQAEQASAAGSAAKTPGATNTGITAALLYYLAEAQADAGQQAQAGETAAKARALSPGNSPAALFAHWEIGESLRDRGLFAWAQAEYRQVIDSGVPDFQVIAQSRLSEMQHDQGDDLAAARTLEEMLRINVQQLQIVLGRIGQTPAEIRARMNYFYACHWQQQADLAKQREYLDKAIASDPGEVDTLIACYKLPGAAPEYREQARKLIAKSVADMRRQIEAMPDEPSLYNQLAWLVGNTEGDVNEALRLARKAVQMSPDSGAYYDTLAHVYFGKGDYPNAVKFQAKAAELEPHSGLIVKELKVFRAKLDQTEKAKSRDGKGPKADSGTPKP